MFTLPFAIIKFWYLEAPVSIFNFFTLINRGFFDIFSLPLMVKTFFKPWKNEYRKGFIGFSRAMGMFFKSIFIAADLFMLFFIFLFEFSAMLIFLLFPVVILYLAFVI
jgi:hypothetical protein